MAQKFQELSRPDHGAMPFPAYKILKDHIRRITAKMAPAPGEAATRRVGKKLR